ncbi:MAG TPA: glycosyltransferase, partial [Thermoanaerobaculia bacterium]|nr:glycosyltransferase [Thermoanaerobaculia bacterium]
MERTKLTSGIHARMGDPLPDESGQPLSPTSLPLARSVEVDVSVVIVTWNSAAWIGLCLEALPAACGTLRYEVIVHDNASADRTAEVAEASPIDELRVMRGVSNDGFAGGVNQSLRATRGRYLLLLNPDCIADPGSISRLVEHLEREPKTAAAAPLLVD